ncbi:protein TIC 22-like, chloroplastic [Rutidosis leptorrhynchoides]|uniref:protein TIC 22-like, chloroplastic n=1 Tax=Rutidosis leptorrhynchoides TaxID=125765 RepID=UPI003A9A3325
MDSSSSSSPAPPKKFQFNLQQTINNFQNQFSSFLQNLNNHQPLPPFLNPNPNSNNFNFELTLSDDGNKNQKSNLFAKNLPWARITTEKTVASGAGMTDEDIEQRLAGVPVYALSNSSEEFVVVSGQNPVKSLGLLCFKEQDAETLLGQMKAMDPSMRPGSKVVPVALSMVFQLKVNGVSFRFIPESSQIKNAIEERRKAGVSDDSFSGVPVFQSRSLVLRSQNKRYRPAFFRKEDLEKSLAKASVQQKHLNPALRVGDLEVAVLEDIIHGMKDDSSTVWDDVVFIPPGFDVSTDTSRQ